MYSYDIPYESYILFLLQYRGSGTGWDGCQGLDIDFVGIGWQQATIYVGVCVCVCVCDYIYVRLGYVCDMLKEGRVSTVYSSQGNLLIE